MTNIKHIVGFVIFVFVIIATLYVHKIVTAPEENISPVPVSISYAKPTIQEKTALIYEVQSSVVMNLSYLQTYTRLKVKWNGKGSAPEKIWIWTYFFAENSNGKTWFSKPVEINKPFAEGNTADIEVRASNDWYKKMFGQFNFYARVNVSAVSAEDARLPSEKINTDIREATPVLIVAN